MENYNNTTGITNAAIGDKLAVMMDATVADGVKLPTAATVEIVGITRGAATASGQTVEIQMSGHAKCTAADTIARGDYVKVDTAGKVVATATAGDKAIGVCAKGGAANETVTIYLRRFTV